MCPQIWIFVLLFIICSKTGLLPGNANVESTKIGDGKKIGGCKNQPLRTGDDYLNGV